MSKSARNDIRGEILAKTVNRMPTAERTVKATYVPHLGIMVVEKDQAGRLALFRENRLLYEENKVKQSLLKRKDLAGGWPMRIPELDLEEIRKKHPESRYDAPVEERVKFFKKLYRDHPEYRIG